MSAWHFIPQPVEIREEAGECFWGKSLVIVLPAAADDHDLFAVGWLQDELESALGYGVTASKRFANDYPGLALVLARADRDGGWLGSETDLPELPVQGYHLRITDTGVLLVGADAPGLFYGVQTLLQLLKQTGEKLPALTITDYPAFPTRGVMLDISRGKVPTLETLLELVEMFASWKINHLQLYLEHTFHWPSHPKIGQGYDPLTAEDILVVDASCAQRHIAFVPNLQSFGHQGHLLRLPEYAHLAESDRRWTLSPTEAGTYELLDDLYAEFLPNFRSRLFNVDSDETWDLGKGKSASLVEEKGLGRVYLDHILRLRELAAKYDRRIMFWGDVILHAPELIPEIPDDVIVLQWDYRREPSEESVQKFADAGKQFYVCPGTNTWSAFYPRQADARGNIRALAAYGARHGALGLLNTDWGDGGHYNLQGLSFYAYAFGAAESWLPGSTGDFDAAFGRLFFGEGGETVMKGMRMLERIAEPVKGLRISDAPDYHMGFLTGKVYRERLTPEAVAVMKESAMKGVSLLKSMTGSTQHPLVVDELLSAAQQDLLFAEKAELAVAFHQLYAEIRARNDVRSMRALVKRVRPRLRQLAKATARVPERFAPLWLARARQHELHNVLQYQMEVPEDLLAAVDWLTNAAKTAKRTGIIPELPEANENWTPKMWGVQMG
ncbi:MAG: glycoside hydrolase family 20 zincin-like fold domain-containing protein [Armatimonadota bacterium]